MGPSLIKNVVLVYTDLLMIHSENIVTLIDSFGKKKKKFSPKLGKDIVLMTQSLLNIWMILLFSYKLFAFLF